MERQREKRGKTERKGGSGERETPERTAKIQKERRKTEIRRNTERKRENRWKAKDVRIRKNAERRGRKGKEEGRKEEGRRKP